ncbi:uncharacterized protein LOC128955589 [Oppia nitens]|uniref:uncharacterized protein LOC128955589 n=1 Tax=Oppia nitens TaxID=1686743 RepID=UPI0023DAFF97|nr:uncharacterized protein LOC128955589 [Oppia nitens]
MHISLSIIIALISLIICHYTLGQNQTSPQSGVGLSPTVTQNGGGNQVVGIGNSNSSGTTANGLSNNPQPANNTQPANGANNNPNPTNGPIVPIGNTGAGYNNGYYPTGYYYPNGYVYPYYG